MSNPPYKVTCQSDMEAFDRLPVHVRHWLANQVSLPFGCEWIEQMLKRGIPWEEIQRHLLERYLIPERIKDYKILQETKLTVEHFRPTLQKLRRPMAKRRRK